MKTQHTIALFALLMLLGNGCGTPRTTPAYTAPRLAPDRTQQWQLVAIRGRELKRTDAVITLSFNTEAQTLAGQAACNTYQAPYTLRPAERLPEADCYTIATADLWTSGVECPEAAMNADARYLSLLRKADKMHLSATTLVLYSKGKELLRYELQ